MPYISASIMMQLLTAVIPQLGRLARGRWWPAEDHAVHPLCDGRALSCSRDICWPFPFSIRSRTTRCCRGLPTRWRSLGFRLVADQGMSISHRYGYSLTTGTLFLMWLGDQITERGIGNGISLIITIGIVARLPAALAQAWKTFVPRRGAGTSQVNPPILVLMVAFLFIVIAGVIAITQGVRKITVQYAKRVVGRKMYGGQTQYMPLKVNYAGVMPIIFAWALLLFPTTIVSVAFPEQPERPARFRRCSQPAGSTTWFWRR